MLVSSNRLQRECVLCRGANRASHAVKAKRAGNIVADCMQPARQRSRLSRLMDGPVPRFWCLSGADLSTFQLTPCVRICACRGRVSASAATCAGAAAASCPGRCRHPAPAMTSGASAVQTAARVNRAPSQRTSRRHTAFIPSQRQSVQGSMQQHCAVNLLTKPQGTLCSCHLGKRVRHDPPWLLLEARGLALFHASSGFAHEPITRRVLAVRVGQQLRVGHVHLQPVLQDLQ